MHTHSYAFMSTHSYTYSNACTHIYKHACTVHAITHICLHTHTCNLHLILLHKVFQVTKILAE